VVTGARLRPRFREGRFGARDTMANDLSNPVNATAAQGHDGFFDHGTGTDSLFGTVQLAQADGAAQATPGQTIHVTPPQGTAGPVVIRVPVAPGSIVELPQPFDADAAFAAKEGDGNLAIRVGDVTVILQGYVAAANDPEQPVTIEGADGKPIDIATILASTDPAIDIQTAAGPGDSQGGQGADNTGAILAQLEGGNGLGGLESVGGQDQTELGYSLIDGGLRQEFAANTLVSSNVFGFSVGAFPGAISEGFLRDPAQTQSFTHFSDFMEQYKDAVENPTNPMYPGWADFNGTGATDDHDFETYLGQTSKITTVDANFTGATGDLVLTGIVDGVTSNGSRLSFDVRDGGHTMFVTRDDATATDTGNALVAVIHVEGPDVNGEFTIQTILINRLDHPDAGKDEMSLEVQFKVYDGPAPNSQPHEGGGTGDEGPQSPSIQGSFSASFADDVPILESVKYHNQHELILRKGEIGSDIGRVDEDWLNGGAKDTGVDGTSNAGHFGDTGGGTCVTGCIKVDFGADGARKSDGIHEELGKHAFELNTGYKLGDTFMYQGSALTSGHEKLIVLSISGDHITVGIENAKQQVQALVEGGDETPSESKDPIPGCTIFQLTLNQATGTFEFDLKGPLDHGTPSDAIFGDETGVSALTDEVPEPVTEETISLAFGVTAYDDDGDKVQAEIDIDVNDDVPVARDDHDHVEKGSYDTIYGDVMNGYGEDSSAGIDSEGGDGAVVLGVAAGELTGVQTSGAGTVIHGTYGTLFLGLDGGKYSYTRDAGSKGGVDDVFTYTLIDGDGDTSTATLTIHIDDAGVCIALPTCPADTMVDEAGLPARNGESAGSDAASDSEQTGGTVTITAKDGIQSLDIAGHELTLGALKDLGNTPFKITDSTGELTLTGFNEGTGALSYTYVLKDNTPGDGQSVSFDITVKDIDDDEKTATLTIKIVDDEPTANCDTISLNATKQPTADVQFIFDVSGSMEDFHVNVPGSSYPDNGIGLERYAAAQMLAAHPEIQNVQVVLFSDHASHSVWMTATAALAYLQNSGNFNGGGATNYDLALTEAMNAYDASARPLPQGDQTLLYFFSDGGPNQPNNGAGITGNGTGSNVSVTEWETFVNTAAHDISNVFAVGVGSISPGELGQLLPISYPNTDTQAPLGQEDNYLSIGSSNVTALVQTLDHVIVPVVTPITGDVTLNDVPGADGFGSGKLVAVTYEGVAHDFDATHHQFTIDLGAERGTLVINDDGTYTYTPPAGKADGTPFFVEYTIQDGDGDKSTAKLKIDINTVPETDLNGAGTGANGTASFIEQTPVLVAPAGTVSDDDGVTKMTVTLTNRPDGNAVESLSLDSAADATRAGAGLTFSYNASTGVATITGPTAPAAVYQTILQGILYNNTSDTPNTATRNVTVVVNDGTSDSVLHNVAVSVTPVNDAPTAVIALDPFNAVEQTDLTLSGTIGAQFNMLIGDVDAGGDTVTVTLSIAEGKLTVSEGNSGADVWSGNGTSTVVIKGSVAEINNLLGGIDTGAGSAGSIKYYNGSDSPASSVQLTLTVNDNGENGIGGAKTATDTAIIHVQDVNDKPVTDLDGPGNSDDCDTGFIEQSPVLVAPSATVKDDSGTLTAMSVTLTNRPNGNGVESLALNAAADAARSGAGLSWSYNASTGVLQITGTAAASVYQTILQGILYNNTSDTPNTADRHVTVVVSDGTLSSVSHSIDISVTPVNDAPTAVITPLSFSVNEQTNLALQGKGLSIGDVDSGNDTMTVKLSVGEGALTVSAGNSGIDSISGNGTATVTITGSVMEINNLLGGIDTGAGSAGSLTYYNDSDTPSASTTLKLEVNDNGNNGFGPVQSAFDTAVINIAAVNDAPIACDDNIVTNAGANVFSIPEWALTYNDSDADTSNSSLDLISGAGAVLNASGGTAAHPTDGVGTAGTVTFTDSGGNGGSFDYKVTDGSQTDTGHVSVTQDTTGTLSGSSGDDIVVVYGSTGTKVDAGSGDDIVIGGGGKDTLDGGSGTDLIFGQGGDDTMIFGGGDKYDGGSGFDRVQVTGSGTTVTYNSGSFLNVEMMDIGDASDRSGSSNQNTLALNAADLGVHNYGTIGGMQISLFVIGDSSGSNSNNRDNVDLTGFHQEAGVSGKFTDAASGAEHTFGVWTSNANAAVHVAIEQNLDVV
jgi:hypothetical protein